MSDSINLKVTVQEGGRWLIAEYEGSHNELIRHLFNKAYWVEKGIMGLKEDKPFVYFPEKLSIEGGMACGVFIHSAKIPRPQFEEIFLTYDSQIRGFTEMKDLVNKTPKESLKDKLKLMIEAEITSMEETPRAKEIVEDLLTCCKEARELKNTVGDPSVSGLLHRLNRIHQALSEGGKPSDYE